MFIWPVKQIFVALKFITFLSMILNICLGAQKNLTFKIYKLQPPPSPIFSFEWHSEYV